MMRKEIRNKTFMHKMLAGGLFSLLWTSTQAAEPLWTIVPSPGSNPTQTVPENSTATVQYWVQNQSAKPKNLILQPTPGITQMEPCKLAPKGQTGSSCILNIAINGSALSATGVYGGPNLCQASPNGVINLNQCYQPSAAHILHITKSMPEQVGIAVSPAALDLVAGSGTPGFLNITNNSTIHAALNVKATLPASWTDVTQDASNCLAIAPNGGTCQLQFTPGLITHAGTAITIAGDNTTQATAQLSVSAPTEANLSVTGGPLHLVLGCSAAGVLIVQNNSMILDATNIAVDLQNLTGDVTANNNCPNSLPPGQSCTIDLTGVNIAPASDISIQGSNTPAVLSNVSVAAPLSIGDSYMGGIIFEVDGCNVGKVVTGPLDGSTELMSQWSSSDNYVVTTLAGGAQNTINITTNDPGCTTEANCAALRCKNLNSTTLDWYLPARNELQSAIMTLCPNPPNACSFGGFSNAFYWSSSVVYDFVGSWDVLAPWGGSYVSPKDTSQPVRCVRAFIP